MRPTPVELEQEFIHTRPLHSLASALSCRTGRALRDRRQRHKTVTEQTLRRHDRHQTVTSISADVSCDVMKPVPSQTVTSDRSSWNAMLCHDRHQPFCGVTTDCEPTSGSMPYRGKHNSARIRRISNTHARRSDIRFETKIALSLFDNPTRTLLNRS